VYVCVCIYMWVYVGGWVGGCSDDAPPLDISQLVLPTHSTSVARHWKPRQHTYKYISIRICGCICDYVGVGGLVCMFNDSPPLVLFKLCQTVRRLGEAVKAMATHMYTHIYESVYIYAGLTRRFPPHRYSSGCVRQ